MLMAITFMGLFCFAILYAMRTLLGMRHRVVYPLLRLRDADGSNRPLTINLGMQGERR